MLSVFVAAEEDAVALAETLAALVPAAVDGLVRRVTVITPAAPLNDLDRLIDESGAARAVAGGGPAAMWRSQFAGSGADWRLCLIAGMAPAGGWVDAVTRHMARQAGPAVFSVSSG
ncbi:MAG: glycosyl transferase, partial [Rhizobiales bacterium]|nr:glycosyl transferase [Hyphomicrobiales bacterium]